MKNNREGFNGSVYQEGEANAQCESFAAIVIPLQCLPTLNSYDAVKISQCKPGLNLNNKKSKQLLRQVDLSGHPNTNIQ